MPKQAYPRAEDPHGAKEVGFTTKDGASGVPVRAVAVDVNSSYHDSM